MGTWIAISLVVVVLLFLLARALEDRLNLRSAINWTVGLLFLVWLLWPRPREKRR